MSSLLSRNQTLVLAAKSYAEAKIKVFSSCPISFDFFTLFHHFFGGIGDGFSVFIVDFQQILTHKTG